MICCFSDLSQTHFRGTRGIIKKKKKKEKQAKSAWKYEICRKNVYFWKIILFSTFFRLFLNNESTGESKKQQIESGQRE